MPLDSKVNPSVWADSSVPRGALSAPHCTLTSASLPLHASLSPAGSPSQSYPFYLLRLTLLQGATRDLPLSLLNHCPALLPEARLLFPPWTAAWDVPVTLQ